MPIENRLIVRVLTTATAPGLYTCNSCDKVLKATKGFTNVINHLKRFHPAYEEEAEAALRNPNLLPLRLVDQRTSDIYRWVDWIVMDCLPLSFCKRDLVRHNSRLSRISVPTVKRYLDGVVELVAQRISAMLPATFGIVLDG